MENREKASTTFEIKFFLNLPTHHKDFVYEVHHDQVISGSILLSHYPLEKEEMEILQSAYNLFKISKLIGGSL